MWYNECNLYKIYKNDYKMYMYMNEIITALRFRLLALTFCLLSCKQL